MTVRVLIAEDSPTVSEMLKALLETDPEIQVVASARDGLEAVDMVRLHRPDLITMDIEMPGLNGFQATKRIMTERPTPIVIVSGHLDVGQVGLSLQALRAGALTVCAKPAFESAAELERAAAELTDVVKAMAEVKVIRHRESRRRQRRASRAPGLSVVAVAASTGGPVAIQRLLQDLPGDFPAPIVVVQHISPGFTTGFASWLDAGCGLHVRLAEAGEALQGGTVYVAPEGRHLEFDGERVALVEPTEAGGFCPSATNLFRSASVSFGARAIGVILTGMGRDGVAGLSSLSLAGGRVLAQDERSSIVFGMPAAAIGAGVVDEVLPLGLIGSRLSDLVAGSESVSRRGRGSGAACR